MIRTGLAFCLARFIVPRHLRFTIGASLLAIASICASACSSFPVADDLQKTVTGAAKRKLFEKKEQDAIENWRILDDVDLTRYVTEVGERVRKSSDVPPVSYFIIDTPVVQAVSSYTDAAIYITRGMITAMNSEAELACLIGHELHHQEQFLKGPEKTTDPSNSVRREVLEQIAPDSLRGFGIQDDLDDISYANFSKARETSADEAGIRLCHHAGYDPKALSSLLKRLSVEVRNGVLERIKKLKGSHEGLAERAHHLEEIITNEKLAVRPGTLTAGHFNRALAKARGRNDKLSREQERTLEDLSRFEKMVENSDTEKSEPWNTKKIVEIVDAVSNIIRKERITAQEFLIITPSGGGRTSDSFMEERVVNLRSKLGDYRSIVVARAQGILLGLSRIALGFTPYVGSAIDLYEVVRGKDFFSEEALSASDRALTALGFVIGQGGNLRRLEQAILPSIRNASEVRQIVRAAETEAKILGAENVVRHGPMNPGRLHEIPSPAGTVADTFRSGTYRQLETVNSIKLYRGYSDDSKQLAHYWSLEPPKSRLQTTVDSAIDPSWSGKPTKWIEITVPANETVYLGASAPIRPGVGGGKTADLVGGGSQVYVEKAVPPSWITGKGDLR